MVALLALSFVSLLTGASASCLHTRDTADILQKRAPGDYGYIGLNGPVYWYGLDPTANALCAKGKNQTPINIEPGSGTTRTLGAGSRPEPSYPNMSDVSFENLKTTVQVFTKGGSLRFEGVDYDLQQFHFHLPSEHLIRKEHEVMEAHFVHQSRNPGPDGRRTILVFGVLLQVSNGAGTKLFDDVLKVVGNISSPGAKTTIKELKFDEINSIIRESDLYTYSGSLTTPPCSEGVRWLVSSRILTVSVERHNQTKRVTGFNSRFPQNDPDKQNVIEAVCQAPGL